MSDQEGNQGIPEPEGAVERIDTDYEIGQHNIEGELWRFGFDIHNPVFMISGLSIIAFVFYALALPEQSGALFSFLFSSVTKGFDWFFLLAGDIFVVFCLALIVSPLGKVRLGGKEATPDASISRPSRGLPALNSPRSCCSSVELCSRYVLSLVAAIISCPTRLRSLWSSFSSVVCSLS